MRRKDNMEKDLKSTIGLFIKWAKEKDVKDSFINYIYQKDNIYLKRGELKNIKNLYKILKFWYQIQIVSIVYSIRDI